MSSPNVPLVPTRRYALAWALLVAGLLGAWACRPWLTQQAFNYAQLIALLVSWKVASLVCLPSADWPRLPPGRLFAYCLWPGMQPRQFLRGAEDVPGAPVPTVVSFLGNLLTGVTLLWLVPYLLPAATPLAVRFWIALTGLCFFVLFARFDLLGLVFRALGFKVEKLWDNPAAATTVGEFWGQRWNRVVSGLLREVVFFPLARRVGARLALFAVFVYSGFYHEGVSFMAGAGHGGPMLYFLAQCLGVALESARPVRRYLQRHPWQGRAWTMAVVVLPLGLLLPTAFLDEYLMPLLAEARVPGLG